MRTPKGTPKGSPGTCTTKLHFESAGKSFWSGPLPMTSVWRHFRSKGPTSASAENTSGQGLFWFRHVTNVTSGHVTSGSTPTQHPHKCDLSCTHILLNVNCRWLRMRKLWMLNTTSIIFQLHCGSQRNPPIYFSYWQTLVHNVVSSTPRHQRCFELLMVISWWYIIFYNTCSNHGNRRYIKHT
jgi:hypothetical protein